MYFYIHASVKNEIASGETDGEIVLGDALLLGIEVHLVTGYPVLVFEDGCAVDQRPRSIDVHITVNRTDIVDVSGLQLAAFRTVQIKISVSFRIDRLLSK